MGLQREKAGRGTLAIYTSIGWAMIFELIVFHTFPSFLTLLGITIILSSAFWVAVRLPLFDSMRHSRAALHLAETGPGARRRISTYLEESIARSRTWADQARRVV